MDKPSLEAAVVVGKTQKREKRVPRAVSPDVNAKIDSDFYVGPFSGKGTNKLPMRQRIANCSTLLRLSSHQHATGVPNDDGGKKDSTRQPNSAAPTRILTSYLLPVSRSRAVVSALFL